MRSTDFKSFLLIPENFSEMQGVLAAQLERLKLNTKEILRTQLLVEEIFWRMVNLGKIEQVRVKVTKNFFGKIQLQMTAAGAPYNPLVEVTDFGEDDEDYYRMLILKANRQKMSWSHEKNQNVITINVQNETNLQLKLTLAGIVGGVACGLLMNALLDPQTISLFDETIVDPLNEMFLNALKMVIAPVIFFSVLSGMTNMGSGANVGRIGAKLTGLYLGTSMIAAIVGLTCAQIFFGGDVPQMGTVPAAKVESQEFSAIQFFVGIIPANLISPIVDGNLMQVIFIAVLSGICLNALGDKVKPLQDFAAACNEFFMKMVGLIILFVPLVSFLAMNKLTTGMDVEMVLMAGKLIVSQLIGNGALLGVYMLMILFVGKISPLPFAKKIPTLWPVPFATSSSAVTIPFTMKFCTESGVSPKISSFAIPIGATVNMNGACIYLPTAAIMFLKMYGVEVDMNALMIILAMTVFLSVGAPAVPNAAVVCIVSIVSMFGVPADIAGILFCIGIISERVVTCFNVTGDAAATIALARTENLLDEKIYFS